MRLEAFVFVFSLFLLEWISVTSHRCVHANICGFSFCREMCLAWNSRVGSQNTNAPAHRVQALFNDLGLYPTSAQGNSFFFDRSRLVRESPRVSTTYYCYICMYSVAEMMQCVMKCANRSSPVYMTFGEFCLLAKKLKNGLDRG